MLLQVILEGLGLGALLVLVCAAGIRKGAVGMVHLYSPAVQQRCVKLGLTTHEKIKRNSLVFQSRLRPRLYQLCAGLCLWDKRCAWFSCGLLAAAGDLIHYESDRPLFNRWLLGGTYERMGNPGNGRPEALYHHQGQGQKVAVWHGGHGSHSGGACGNYDAFYGKLR